jgi:integrase
MARKSTTGIPYLRFHKGKNTYLYTLPGGREVNLGPQRASAERDAREANRERDRQEAQRGANAALSALRGDTDEDTRGFLVRWARDIAPELTSRRTKAPLSPQSITRYQRTAELAADGDDTYSPLANGQPVRWVTPAHINKWLDQFPSVQANRHRSALSLAWKFAVREGLADSNVVRDSDRREELLRRADGTVAAQRDRLSLEDYRAVRGHETTPAWLVTAMDLSLGLGLRLADVQSLRWDAISEDGTELRVTPAKTAKTSGVTIVYHLGERIRQVLADARSNIASPYIVHYLPKRKVRGADRDHWTQLSKEQISKTFTRQRDAAGITRQQDRTPQTFHEVRALSAHLYETQLGAEARAEVMELKTAALTGAQAALGHSSAQMTARYATRAGREIHVRAELDW